MTQSRIGSLIEVAINILIGFAINWVCNMVILPLYGFPITGSAAFSMGLVFTVISVARGYIIRRWFNAKLHAMSLRLAGEKELPPAYVVNPSPLKFDCAECTKTGYWSCHCPQPGDWLLIDKQKL